MRWRGGSGISWIICKCKSFAPCSRQIIMPAPQQSIFPGRILYLMPNKQCQSTEGKFLGWILLQPFYNPLSGTTQISQYQKKQSPTHLSWSSTNLYQLLPSTLIHSILLVQFTSVTIFLHNLSPSPLSLVYLLVWSPPPHTPYISLPNQCLLFATHAHTIATCFAVVPRLYHLFLISVSTFYFELNLLP